MTMELGAGAAALAILSILGCWLSLQVDHASVRRGLIALSLLVPILLGAVALELYIIVHSTAVSRPMPMLQLVDMQPRDPITSRTPSLHAHV
jgi:hypothetical protein